jgi:hypothetical protein
MTMTSRVRVALALLAFIAPGFNPADKLQRETHKIERQAEKLSRMYRCNEYSGPSSTAGSYRSVYMSGSVVFKAVTRPSCQDNQREWKFYSESSDELKAMCVKPLYISENGRVIVMQRVVSTLLDDSKWYCDSNDRDDALETFNTIIGDMVRDEHDEHAAWQALNDNHGDNVGVTETGELLWIDYAGYDC